MSVNLKEKFQFLWGVLLVIMGFGVFIRIPDIFIRIKDFGQFNFSIIWMKFSFYFLALFLIGGGIKKIYNFLKNKD